MIGLIFIGIVLVYLAIVVAAPIIGARFAKNAEMGTTGIWLVGIGGFLLVTVPIFWDWAPTVMTWKQLCNKDAGFFVYKTPEQWKQENPGVAETLTYKSLSDEIKLQDGTRYLRNQRIAWDTRNMQEAWGVWQRHETVVDLKTGQVLALYRNYSTGVSGSLVGGAGGGLRAWKLWMARHTCEADSTKEPNLNGFSNMMVVFSKMGSKQ